MRRTKVVLLLEPLQSNVPIHLAFYRPFLKNNVALVPTNIRGITNKIISIDDKVALEKEKSQINEVASLTAKTAAYERSIIDIKKLFPSVDVLKSVYANEPKSLVKKF